MQPLRQSILDMEAIMSVADIYEKRATFSFEVFPPKTDVGIMPILDQAATINMALSRNGCVMDRKLCEIISKNWIFPNPFDKEPFDADVAGKKESFRKAGIEYTINQIDEYRACGIDGIHLYALNKYEDVAYIAKEAGLIDLV